MSSATLRASPVFGTNCPECDSLRKQLLMSKHWCLCVLATYFGSTSYCARAGHATGLTHLRYQEKRPSWSVASALYKSPRSIKSCQQAHLLSERYSS